MLTKTKIIYHKNYENSIPFIHHTALHGTSASLLRCFFCLPHSISIALLSALDIIFFSAIMKNIGIKRERLPTRNQKKERIAL